MRGVAVLLSILVAFTVACGGSESKEEQIRALEWEVLQPNAGDAVGLVGDNWTLGLRATENEDTLVLVTRVTAPNKAVYETEQTISEGDWAESIFPLEFPGGSNDVPGTYAVEFEVEGIQVGRDSFTTIPAEPNNSELALDMFDPLYSSDGSTHFSAEIRNDAEYHSAVDIVVQIRLEDASGFVVAEPEMTVRDLGPGDSTTVNFTAVPADVPWEFYVPNLSWAWDAPVTLSDTADPGSEEPGT
jgi:hypothetical protein